MEIIRVLVADEQPLMRAGVALLLGSETGIQVVAEVATADEFIIAARKWTPDVALADLEMTEGLDAIRTVAETGVRVFVLTGRHLDGAIYAALRAGAVGFLLKDAAPAELVQAIKTVAAGEGWLDPAITRELLREFAARAEPGVKTPQELRQLTGREREVLVLVAQGFSNRDIAERLYISEGTVKSHVGRVLTKLRLRDRAQAVAAAYQSGLMVVPPRQ